MPSIAPTFFSNLLEYGGRMAKDQDPQPRLAKRLTHAARAVFNDCMISPWY